MNYAAPLLPSKFYHIYNHAVGDENLFRNEDNFQYFLKKYAQYIQPFCKTYAYCLMPNHFHFLISVRDEVEIMDAYKILKNTQVLNYDNIEFDKILMQQFSNFFNGYSKAYNNKYNRKGALFLDYLRRIEVSDEEYFTRLINYIHSNPVHHGFVKSPKDWTYSSYKSIISPKQTNLEKEEVIKWFGSLEEFVNFNNLNTLRYTDKELGLLEFI